MKRRIAYKVMDDPERYRADTVARALLVVRKDARRWRVGAVGIAVRMDLRSVLAGVEATMFDPDGTLGIIVGAMGETLCSVQRAMQDRLDATIVSDLERYRWESVPDPTPRH